MNNEELQSIDSYEEQFPQSYVPEPAPYDGAGTASGGEAGSSNLKLVPTETAKSLQDMGLTSEVPIPDFNAPTTSVAKNAIFPEEYTLETATGLVPVATLHSLGRTPTAISRTRTRQMDRQDASSSEEKNDEEPDEELPSHIDKEVEFVTFVTNDPENPHNWPLWIRWSYTILMSVLVIAVAYGSACITGGLFTVEEKFHVSQEVAILSCSLMVIGFSLGPLIWSPVSDLYGRRVAYFISLGLYVIFNIPCALAKNIGTLLVCRFLCGVWSSSGLCLVGGSIADMFPAETRGRAIAFFAYAPYCGPVFGPLVNGFIAISTNRMDLIFWVNMAFAGVMWIIVSCIPETYAPVILKKRAKRLRIELNNPKIMTEQEAQGMSVSELVRACLLRPLYFAVTEPVLDLMLSLIHI